MTVDAGCRDAKGSMIWIGGVVVVGLVATYAGVWSIVIVPAHVTAVAINGYMSSGQRVIIVVNGESSRSPSGICGMTGRTGCRNAKCNVIWISRLVII